MPRSRMRSRQQKIREYLISRQLKRARGERLPDPPILDSPRGNAILVRGLASWPDDKTFKVLESRLVDSNIQVIRFSYYRYGFSCYWPIDTIGSISHFANTLDSFVQNTDEGIPLWILAHSIGGNIVAYWITRAKSSSNHQEMLDKIEKIFLFASPVFPLINQLNLTHPITERTLRVDLEDYPRNIFHLLRRYPRSVSVLSSADDFATIEEASLVRQKMKLGLGPLYEHIIPDCPHDDICNHADAVNLVLQLIDQGS